MTLRRTGFRPYVVKHCDVCNGDRPHSGKGACQACKRREKTRTPLERQATALQRAKTAWQSPTKQAAKDALPIAQAIVKRRANGMCEHCGRYAPYGHAHHRRPQQAGGSSSLTSQSASNLLWLLPECHLERIEKYRTWAYEQGFLVYQDHEPAVVPVHRYDGWFLLADDGSMQQIETPGVGAR